MACQFLATTEKLDKLEQLISLLVTTHPRACGQYDHNGRLPLHEAINWNASSSIISIIFVGCPDAAYQSDASGLKPIELLQLTGRSDTKEILEMMREGSDLWNQSRQEAMMRFTLGFRTVDSELASSTAALVKFHGGRISLESSRRLFESSRSLAQADTDDHMEKSVSDLQRRNNDLVEALRKLTTEKDRLQEIVEKGSTLEKVYQLEDENIDLRRKLHRREIFLHDNGFDASANSFAGTSASEDQKVSMMSMDPETPTVLTRYLETKVKELAEEAEDLQLLNDELREHNDTLNATIVELQLPKASYSGDTPGTKSVGVPSETTGSELQLKQRIAELELQLIEANAEKSRLQTMQQRGLPNGGVDQSSLPPDGRGGKGNSLADQLKEIDRQSAHSTAKYNYETPEDSHRPPGKAKRRKSLEDQLLEIDRRSSHDGPTKKPNRAKPEDTDGFKKISETSSNEMVSRVDESRNGNSPSQATGRSFDTEYSETGHDSFQTGHDSQGTGRFSVTSRVSTSSWGMLCIAQNVPSKKRIRKRWSTPLETLPQGSESRESLHNEAFHESVETFAMHVGEDKLDELYKSAVDLFDDAKLGKTPFDGHTSTAVFDENAMRRNRKNQRGRRNSDGGMSPALERRKNVNKLKGQDNKSDALVETARMLAAEEEISAIIKETEEIMGSTLNDALVAVLREASLSTVSDRHLNAIQDTEDHFRFHHVIAEALVDYKLIDATEKMYGKTIPPDTVSSLRASAISRIETSRQEIEAMEFMKRRLEVELLDALIETAERQLHRPLEFDVVMALRGAAASSHSLLQEELDKNGLLVSLHLDFREMDRMFDKAQKAVGRPFSEETIVALRRASFVLQSRLEGADFSVAHESTASTLYSGSKSSTYSDSDKGSISAVVATNRFLASPPSRSASPRGRSLSEVAPLKPGQGIDGLEFPDIGQESTGRTDDMMAKAATSSFHKTGGTGSDPGPKTSIRAFDTSAASRSHSTLESNSSGGKDSPRRPPGMPEGGSDPGVMYSVARARSRSPTGLEQDNLNVLYDRAILARTRNSSPDNGEELGDLYKRASLGRTSAHEEEDDIQASHIAHGDEDFVSSAERAKTVSDLHALFPPKRKTSAEEDDINSIQSNGSESDQESSSEDPPLVANSEKESASEPDSILKAAKDLLGQDITPELLDALKLLSVASGKVSPQPQSPNGMANTFVEDNDDMRSTDMSRQSEISLNLSAVFNPNQTSELERKLRKLDQPSRREKTRLSSPSGGQIQPHHEVVADATSIRSAKTNRSPIRGVRKTRSGDLLSATLPKSGRRIVRRSKSAESSKLYVPASPGTSAGLNPLNESFAKLTGDGASDDLDQLYKDAVKQSEGDSSLLASTHHMPNKKGVAAFDSIISDTEETYGIAIPKKIINGMKDAILGGVDDVPFISIVRSLHEDSVIKTAEENAGESIPVDLLIAIRSTSLPPGVSVESLRPLEGSASLTNTKKYNVSVGSSGFSLTLTDSSRRSRSTPDSPFSTSTQISASTQKELVRDVLGTDQAEKHHTGNDSQLSKHLSAEDLLASLPGTDEEKSHPDNESQQSDNSWGVLSLSKSPSATQTKKRVRRRATKKHRKGTKDAMFERAQMRKDKAAQFMNSLADLGTPTDDLGDLYQKAKQSLDAVSPDPSKVRKQQRPKKIPPKQRRTGPSQDGELGDVAATQEASIPRPQNEGSCIALSPQEAELDMLLTRFAEVAGRPMPFDIDVALRKASRAMDDSIDFVAPWSELSNREDFGNRLSPTRLRILYGEAEIFLGRDIDEGILETLIGASHYLATRGRSTEDLGLRGKYSDTLLDVAQGAEDDLNNLYRAAYDESPRISPSKSPTEKISLPLLSFKSPSKSARKKDDPMSPKTPSFLRRLPLAQVNPVEDDLELTESGRFVVSLSPMTEASMGTHISLGNSQDKISMLDAAKARLRSLSELPNLEKSSTDLELEEESEQPLNDAAHESDPRSQTSRNLEFSQTSFELDAIIFEVQEEYGMTLPPELVEALKTASVSSFTDFDSVPSSHMSSLIMKHLESDDNAEQEISYRDAVMDVREKLSQSQDLNTRLLANRWRIEEALECVLRESEKNVGYEIPSNILDAIRYVVIAVCDENECTTLTWDVFEVALKSLDGIVHEDRSRERIVAAMKKAFDSLDHAHSMNGSGYFSAVSDSVLVDDLDYVDDTGDIMQEIEQLNDGLIHEQIDADEGSAIVDYSTDLAGGRASATVHDEDSAVLEYSGDLAGMHVTSSERSLGSSNLDYSSDLVGARLTGSSTFEYSTDLEYSESTLSSLPLGSSHSQGKKTQLIRKMSHASGRVSTTNDDSLSTIEESMQDTDLDGFLAEVAKEYGQPLPEELAVALKQVSVSSGLTFEEQSRSGHGDGNGNGLNIELSPGVTDALKRTVHKTSNHIPRSLQHLRQNSIVSALSGFSKQSSVSSFNTSASSVEFSGDGQEKYQDNTAANEEEQEIQETPPLPPPPPPPPLPESESSFETQGSSAKPMVPLNFGPTLLREVKKVYNRNIPLELTHVLNNSATLEITMNTDEDIRVILEECEDMSGKRLPADLVLALREASVATRAPPAVSKSKSRRQKMMRQGSANSFRSRSSGMPSIQEWTASTGVDDPPEKKEESMFEVDRVPSSFGALAIPAEIAAEERSNMDVSTLKDSQHTDGTSVKPARPSKRNETHDFSPVDPSVRDKGRSFVSTKSAPEFSEHEHSIAMDALFASKGSLLSSNGHISLNQSGAGSARFSSYNPHASPAFNASEATMLISNKEELMASTGRGFAPLPVIDGEEEEADETGNTFAVASLDSTLTGTGDTGSVISAGSSTSTEVTANNSRTLSAIDDLSRASTLTSRKLPIGVNPSPPLPGVETDDLSAIFKEAARRFSHS